MAITTQYMREYLNGLDVVSDIETETPLLLAVTDRAVAVPTDAIATFKRYGKVQTINNATGNITLDMSLYDVFNINATGNITIGVAGTPPVPYQCLIRIKQAGASAVTASWPASFKFSGDVTPTLTTTVGGSDMFIAACLETGRVELAKSGSFPA